MIFSCFSRLFFPFLTFFPFFSFYSLFFPLLSFFITLISLFFPHFPPDLFPLLYFSFFFYSFSLLNLFFPLFYSLTPLFPSFLIAIFFPHMTCPGFGKIFTPAFNTYDKRQIGNMHHFYVHESARCWLALEAFVSSLPKVRSQGTQITPSLFTM